MSETNTPAPLPVRLDLLETRVAVLRQNVEWLQEERLRILLQHIDDLRRYRRELFGHDPHKG